MKNKTDSFTIVMGVIGADCHAVGNRILEMVFSKAGFKVVNLGVLVSQQEFIDASLKSGAKAILVSSLYGHGEIDSIGFRDKCTKSGLDNIILYIGGRLVIGKTDFSTVVTKFKKLGFDRVFPPDCDLDEAIKLLKNDIIKQNLNSSKSYGNTKPKIKRKKIPVFA